MALAQDTRSMDYICRNLLAGGEKKSLNCILRITLIKIGFRINWPHMFAELSKHLSGFVLLLCSIPIEGRPNKCCKEIPVAVALSRCIFTTGIIINLVKFFGRRVDDVTWQLIKKMNFQIFLPDANPRSLASTNFPLSSSANPAIDHYNKGATMNLFCVNFPTQHNAMTNRWNIFWKHERANDTRKTGSINVCYWSLNNVKCLMEFFLRML